MARRAKTGKCIKRKDNVVRCQKWELRVRKEIGIRRNKTYERRWRGTYGRREGGGEYGKGSLLRKR